MGYRIRLQSMAIPKIASKDVSRIVKKGSCLRLQSMAIPKVASKEVEVPRIVKKSSCLCLSES